MYLAAGFTADFKETKGAKIKEKCANSKMFSVA
jgi:hypothetical protein